MEYKFVVSGAYYNNRTLPGLNDYIGECNKNPRAGGRMKKNFQMVLCNAIRGQLKKTRIVKKVHIHYDFYEPDRQRDKSNIFAVAAKFTEDALQQCGIIKNDGWGEIENFSHEFYVDKKNPRIEVTIREIEVE